ncbi:MAG: TonB family protein [Gammaproteobacteria bacterium]|nr:TonB family protein [Gammaproteobacteria bacterium]
MGTDKSKQIPLCVALSVLTIALMSSVFVRAVTTAPADGNLLKEIEAPLPDYPKALWTDLLEGMVTVMFDVTEEGDVENPCIVNSSLPGKFELYALQAIKNHRYEQLGGPARHMKGATKSFFFSLDSEPMVPVKVKYPQTALESGAEGFVVVQFSVSEWGEVRGQQVVGAEPAGVFEAAALDAAGRMKFETTRFKPDQIVSHMFIFSLDSNPNEAVVATYPAEAKEKQLHGHVIVEFDINADGEVENPEVIYSDASEFETAAITTVSQFSFDPDKPSTEVLHKIEFGFNQDWQSLSKVEPEYPEQALLDNVEGYVIVRFEIAETGSVENVEVIEANPPKIFDQSALSAIKQFKYIPKYVDGQPTRTTALTNVKYVIAREDSTSPGRALGDSSPDPRSQVPMVLPPNAPPHLRNAIVHRPKHRVNPTHTLFIEGNQKNGSVIVEFDVDKQGFVERPNIVEVQGTVLSEDVSQQILEEVGYYWYEPLVIDDLRVGSYGVRHLIELRSQED